MEDLKFDMVRESLARKFRPAGFEQPEGSRKNYVEPRRELQEAFSEWVSELHPFYISWEESERVYKKACNSIQPLGEIPYREANSLLLNFKPKTDGEKGAGLFISACFNQSHENIIIFDTDAPEVDRIGYILGENKVLVNNGVVGSCFGPMSSGFIVNKAESGDLLGQLSSGIILNGGKTGYRFGECSSGTLIALREPKRFNYGDVRKTKRILRSWDIYRVPELKNYLDEMSEITKNIKDEESAKRFLERYGPEPKERIEHDIKDILERR